MINKIKNLRNIKKIIKKLCNSCKAKAATSVKYNTFKEDHKSIWCENCKEEAEQIKQFIDKKTIDKVSKEVNK